VQGVEKEQSNMLANQKTCHNLKFGPSGAQQDMTHKGHFQRQTSSIKGYPLGNADECGVCMEQGQLLFCDDCPASFHAECLGYLTKKQCPRGKWKCYFCKASRNGIVFSQRMAPFEKPICEELMYSTPTWQAKAIQALDIIRNYYCCKVFFVKNGISEKIARFASQSRLLAPDFWQFPEIPKED
jgi:hypothetical protein